MKESVMAGQPLFERKPGDGDTSGNWS